MKSKSNLKKIHNITCASYICEVTDNIFYQESIGNNLFVIHLTPKSKWKMKYCCNLCTPLSRLSYILKCRILMCTHVISVCRDSYTSHKFKQDLESYNASNNFT